jgi:regulator of sigma E protease
MGGPVAIVDIMNTIGQESSTFSQALRRIATFTAFIGVNLAVVNLLPIPALDGGRILLIIITWLVEKITRRKPNPKYEAYINNGTFILLLGLMVFFLINDITRIING